MKNRYLFLPAGVVILTLLIVGSFCDLTIASALFNPNNGFSRFMAAITPFPVSLACGFICGTLLKMVVKQEYKKKWINILLVIISVTFAIATSYYYGDCFTSHHAYNLNTLLNIPFGLIFTVPGYLLGYFFYEKINHQDLLKKYLYLTIVVILLIGMVAVFKALLPRLRYTSVSILGDTYFRPWYLTDFSLSEEFVKEHHLVIDEIRSFPSGHSNFALSTAFIYMYVPSFYPKLKDKEVYFFYGGFLYFLLIAFSRIYIGAHYLSDTMFAGLLCLVVYFIANEIYLRKIVKEKNL